MEITYRPTTEDLIALEKVGQREKIYRRHNLVLKGLIGWVVWCPFIYFVLFNVFRNPTFRANLAANGIGALWGLSGFALPVLLFYLLWFGGPLLGRKMMAKAPFLQNEVRYSIDKNGVRSAKHSVEWVKIQHLISTPTHLFLVDNTNLTFIVPMRIFESEFAWYEFVTNISDYWKNAKLAVGEG